MAVRLDLGQGIKEQTGPILSGSHHSHSEALATPCTPFYRLRDGDERPQAEYAVPVSGDLCWLPNLSVVVTLRISRPESEASAPFSWGNPFLHKLDWCVAERKNTNSLEPVVTGSPTLEENWDR